ncbi:phosphogluconate dehydratase [Bartonella krasnovii]|uniref:Phosphogluconate dehydratase n=1 Tax=Bartonella krasnovii TaxID=2267275 RepID=A0A5B9D0B7_9HYPH|nr:phosphogluconate dehydratase [Bartonella krasnovii]QEE11639.1 phosphogluconate dehydratase [Bartonella krasnovii]UNF40798.1 phosphogluconate dehydratase [Bartonella krasnovii]UNF42456.1 phosphogluconate dehydratase [Bartonella krasnovii]UNF47356.1 phosphogluconate dehydratase [Bartonella krasnovii]UNF52316.1 phosphogluconate dehydratase [Bartonella krasnovii]
MALSKTIATVTRRIYERSLPTREIYLERIANAQSHRPKRSFLGCANQAHGFAACGAIDKERLKGNIVGNIGIITAYNDILSAHQPFEKFPHLIKEAARMVGGVAQVAGGVPAMCDGVTQGNAGMELSLFSREVIAMATAISLSHDVFDAALYLGVCDKIIPGLMIGALTFGHLPGIFIPAGPMTSGQGNDEKAKIRQLYAENKIDRQTLLESEARSYHGPGTCTFYGTANSNQVILEMMGLHMPGASFVNANTPLRDALTKEATKRVLEMTDIGDHYRPLGMIIDERSFVNAIVGLNATGGSTNHTIHLIAMAAACGIQLTWHDIAEISSVVPLLARIYPNGLADINHFHAAGGIGFVIRELIEAGLVHEDISTVYGKDLNAYAIEAKLSADGCVVREPALKESGDHKVLAGWKKPFQPDGGLRVLSGDLGTAIIKVSSVKPEYWQIKAPVLVFNDQEELKKSFQSRALHDKDFIAVIRYQGPKANGMPELHKLTTILGVLQDRGQRVALITDGRMSGASGKIPAAIHVTPEALDNGPIARLQDGDIVFLDVHRGKLTLLEDLEKFNARTITPPDLSKNEQGVGRELFRVFRQSVNRADQGASVFMA